MIKITSIQDIYNWKKEDMAGIRRRIRDAVTETEANAELKKILKDTVGNTGKMIRPLVALLAAGTFRKEAREEILCAAAAGEMLHTSSLLLDDIIDKADTRRGCPSVQATYGVPVALCAGDYLMVTAFSFLSGRGYTKTADEFIRTAMRVCDGEIIQDLNNKKTNVTESMYMDSIKGKTAAVFACCCRVAARIAGRSAEIQKTMAEYGETLGIIFQIRDDIMDWTQDEDTLKKPVNEDFRNGTFTLPAIYAFSDEKYGSELRAYADREALSLEDLAKIREIVRDAGGIKYAQSVLDGYIAKAEKLLESLPDDRYRISLRLLARSLSKRA